MGVLYELLQSPFNLQGICTSFHYLELVPYDLKQIYSLGGLVFAVTEAGRPIWEYKNLGQVAS